MDYLTFMQDSVLIKLIEDHLPSTEGLHLLFLTRKGRGLKELAMLLRPVIAWKRQSEVRNTKFSPVYPRDLSVRPLTRPSQAAGLFLSSSIRLDHALYVWRLARRPATTRVWRVDVICVRTLIGHKGAARAVVDVGGGRVASGGYDCTLRVWDVLSGTQLQQTPTGTGGIRCAIALWGDRVATGHLDTGDIRLWSLCGGGRAAGELRGHADSVFVLAVVSSGTAQLLLASGSRDLSVRLWDVDAGACHTVLAGEVTCLADLGCGRLLSGSEDGSLRVWNVDTGRIMLVVPNSHGEAYDGQQHVAISAACALPSGGAATGSEGGIVLRWKWKEGCIALAPDGAALQLTGGVAALCTTAQGPDGALLLLASTTDGTIWVLREGPGGALQEQSWHETENAPNKLAAMMPAAQ